MFDSNLPDDKRPHDDNPWHNSNVYTNEEDDSKDKDSSDSVDRDGTWGERDANIESRQQAMEEYETLRKELTTLSKERSRKGRDSPSLFRSITGGSSRSRRSRSRRPDVRKAPTARDDAPGSNLATTTTTATVDTEKGEASSDEESEFELEDFMKEGHFEKRVEGHSAKKVGVVWKNLTVKGVGAGSVTVKTLPKAIRNTFGPDLYHIITYLFPFLRFARHGKTRNLINDFTGNVRDGEILLVLGRPGAGCSTFLKAISNNRETFAAVEGEVSYGGIPATKQRKQYRGEVVYLPEGDKHLATLNVWQTLKFSLLNKTKRQDHEEIPILINALLKMFGISHTKYTLVGDEYVRGVSGGERKRVSIAEILATKSSVVCWDSSTTGLDASTALDYTKSLRVMTDVSNRTTVITLYQAGEGIYELVDKVLVIEAGRCIYQGPANKARQYFIDLGFECPDRQTTPDFLTTIGDPAARRYREGYEGRAPRSAEELEAAFRKSEAYQAAVAEVDQYEREIKESDYADAKAFEETAKEQKSKRVLKKSSYTVSFPQQVMACTKREFWLLWGDKTALYTKTFTILVNGFIVASLFYGQSLDTSGAFSRGGTLFFSILFLGWLQLSELMKAVSGREVVARQHEYAFYRPSAVAIARVVTDLPVLLPQTALFSLIMYFLAGLDVNAGKFWIYFLFVYTMTICLTALYRMFAALSPAIDDAVRFSGLALNLLVIYTGYVISKPTLIDTKIWFGWLYYINPIAYAFEAVLTNEFSDRDMECAQNQLVPQGPGIDSQYQGCTLQGSTIGSSTVNGAEYLATSFQYYRKNLWRNWGVIIAFTALYILVTALATELFSFSKGGGGALVFSKRKAAKKAPDSDSSMDEEKGAANGDTSDPSRSNSVGMGGSVSRQQTEDEALASLAKSDSIFTWQDVNYTIPYLGGERKLLNSVSGYAKPGKMVALMGASGAGKTTLLNTLSQRQFFGAVSGEMLVDGRPLTKDFQRATGFCLQQDIHDESSTIREALEFSALLRQNKDVPKAEKLAYVDNVVDLLELNDIQDAIISSLGVEQKKRVTIGVELAAKPELLLFLDEPTSGLDSNSAYSIVRFLRKLSKAGQSIVCTIHQPSSVLIQQFDLILALNPGGNVFYFGEVGDNGSTVIDYFARRGIKCPPHKNVAEFILETAAKKPRGPDGKRINWNQEWMDSDEHQAVLNEINSICKTQSQAAKPREGPDSEREYAASVMGQTKLLTIRMFKQYWRDPSYTYAKLFAATIFGIANGFTFYMLGNTAQDNQYAMFSCFLIIVFPPIVLNGILPKFYQHLMLWMARENPSKIYGWIPFATAITLTEIPYAIVMSVIYWLLWWYPAGLPMNTSTAGYTFLMTMLFQLWTASFGHWIAASLNSFTVLSNVLPTFFVVISLFNGVVRPWALYPPPWKYWLYYMNPTTYYLGGVLAATLNDRPVQCVEQETAKFNVPSGQTCQQYAGQFAESAGGYLLNPDATSDCQYCAFSVGNQYLASLNLKASDKWPYFGIFLMFCITNYMLVYFFIYTVKVKGYTFGFGYIMGAVQGIMGKVSGLLKSKKKTGEATDEEAAEDKPHDGPAGNVKPIEKQETAGSRLATDEKTDTGVGKAVVDEQTKPQGDA